MEKCKVIGCNNSVMEGKFGLQSYRYGYCQIHKIEGTWAETTQKPSTKNNSHQGDRPLNNILDETQGGTRKGSEDKP